MEVVCYPFPKECLPKLTIDLPENGNIISNSESFMSIPRQVERDGKKWTEFDKRKNMVWKESTVGVRKKNGAKTIKSARSSFYTKVEKGFKFDVRYEESEGYKKAKNFEERMKVVDMFREINEKIPTNVNMMMQHMSNIYPKHIIESFTFVKIGSYYDGGKDSVYDIDYFDTWHARSEISKELVRLFPFLTDTYGITLLCYTEGGHFVKHTDTKMKSNHFATTLIFIPTDFTGGDLIITCNTDKVYDPCGFLEKGEGTVRLKMSEIAEPVIISFRINLPHEVETVTSGHRLCYKFIQEIPAGTEYFMSNRPTIIDMSKEDFIKNALQNSCQNEINEIKKQIEILQQKIAELEEGKMSESNDLPEPEEIINLINKSECKDHLIVFPSKIQKETIDINNMEDMADFSQKELDLIYQIFEKYPTAKIGVKNGYRERFDFGGESGWGPKIMCRETAESMLHGEGVGEIYFDDYNGKSIIHYGNPNEFSFGYNIESSTRYNDEEYAGYDFVRVAVVYVSTAEVE